MTVISGDLFKTAFEHSAVSKLVYWPDGKLLYVSQAMRRLLGYNEAELPQLSLADISHPEDQAAEREQLEEVLAGPRQQPVAALEKRFLRYNDDYIWCLQHVTALWSSQDKQPRLHCLVAEVQDIHSRKLYEFARAAERERMLMIEAMAHLGNWQVSFETGQYWMSDECGRILGLEPSLIDPGPLMGLGFVHPLDRQFLFGKLTALNTVTHASTAAEGAIQTAEELEAEFRIVRPGGEIRYVKAKARPSRKSTGQLTGLMGFIMDITSIRLQEQMLAEANRLLNIQNQQLHELALRLSNTLQGTLQQAQYLLDHRAD